MGYPRNLFSLLAPSHEMRVRETLVALCDRSTCPPIGSRRDTSGVSIVRDLLAAGTGVLRQRTAEWTPPKREVGDPGVRAPQAQADLLSAIEPIDEPTLWYLHLLLPHRPWLFYPDGGTYSADGLREWRNRADPWITAIEEQRHLLQLQYADTLVGEVLDALRATGQYDDTVVVVTADHGFSFVVDAPARDPVEANLAQLAYVPLIIKAPGGEPQVPADSNILSYDLLPTLAELLGVDIPWAVHGHPIGSTDQLGRGPEKEMYGASTGDGLERLTFDPRTARPSFAGRQVGPIQRGDDPIAGLLGVSTSTRGSAARSMRSPPPRQMHRRS